MVEGPTDAAPSALGDGCTTASVARTKAMACFASVRRTRESGAGKASEECPGIETSLLIEANAPPFGANLLRAALLRAPGACRSISAYHLKQESIHDLLRHMLRLLIDGSGFPATRTNLLCLQST